MNGQEAPVGQTYATLDGRAWTLAEFGELGQPLSTLGAVMPLEKGPEDDEFFLTFDTLADLSYDRPDDPMLVITPTDDPGEGAPRIGVRTFDEIDATYAEITGVNRASYERPADTFPVDATFQELRQSLPAVAEVDTLLSSHQVAIAQLAIQYCDAAIGRNAFRTRMRQRIWPVRLRSGRRARHSALPTAATFVDPLIARAIGQTPTGPEIATQPSYADHLRRAGYVPGRGRPPGQPD